MYPKCENEPLEDSVSQDYGQFLPCFLVGVVFLTGLYHHSGLISLGQMAASILENGDQA